MVCCNTISCPDQGILGGSIGGHPDKLCTQYTRTPVCQTCVNTGLCATTYEALMVLAGSHTCRNLRLGPRSNSWTCDCAQTFIACVALALYIYE